MNDVMTEMLVGEPEAVRCIGKFYISPRRQEVEGMPLVMIAGSAVSPCGGTLVSPENEGHAEMWECEIIIIPKRKYSGKYIEKSRRSFGLSQWAYEGYRVDQVLVDNFGDPACWGPKYYDCNQKSKKMQTE